MAEQKYFSPEIVAEFLTNFEQNELDVCIIYLYFVRVVGVWLSRSAVCGIKIEKY
jgi:hypothetical protein